jgi:hypothetical protein
MLAPTSSVPGTRSSETDRIRKQEGCPQQYLDPMIAIAGINNQRENLVNMALLSHLWGLTLVLPAACPVGYVDDDPRHLATFPSPWTGVACGAMQLLWDVPYFREHVGVCTIERADIPKEALSKVHVVHLKNWYTRGLGTFTRSDYSVEELRVMAQAIPRGGHAMVNTSTPLTTVVYSRYWDKCEAFGVEVCRRALRALKPSAPIQRLTNLIIDQIGTPYTLVHLRAFRCKIGAPTFENYMRHVRMKCLSGYTGKPRIYLASDFPPQLHTRLSSMYNWSTKQTLAHDLTRRLPFEVKASIDFELAVRSSIFVGWAGDSSFTHFAIQYRRLAGGESVAPSRYPKRRWCVKSGTSWTGLESTENESC